MKVVSKHPISSIVLKVLSKHPIRIGETIVPKGSEGESVGLSPEIKSWFPNMLDNPQSQFLGVKFNYLEKPCLVMKKEIVRL